MTSTSKHLAKNTLYMYMRMIILMSISFYTSRVLLKELGISDYGIYNVVGSIVVMFTSLRGVFSSSTQRYLNFEMGKGNFSRLQKVFSMSVLINVFIALIFILCVECVGIWFLNFKINIDPSRLFAAKVVFQFSVCSAVIALLTTPYDAVIIANERMRFYAGISILEALLKLAIIFLLSFSSVDKLILYSFLLLCVQVIVRFINASYCHKHFPESHYKKLWDKSLFKEMASFAGWNFIGNTGYSLSNEGINMILNVYGGPIVNTARGIAYQIRYALEHFLVNVNKATDPYSMKLYAKESIGKYYLLLYIISKILFSVYLCFAIPLFIYTDNVLKLWLGQIPQYSSIFIKWILIMGIIRSFLPPINVLFYSANKVRPYQIRSLIISLLLILSVWFLLKKGYPFYYAFVAMACFMAVSWITILIQAKKYCNFPVKNYLYSVTLPSLISLSISSVISIGIFKVMIFHSYWFLLPFLLMIIVTCIISYIFSFNSTEKSALLSIVKR